MGSRHACLWKRHKEWLDILIQVPSSRQVAIHFPPLPKLFQPVVKFGGDDNCAVEIGVYLLNNVHPERAAPFHTALLQEQDQPADNVGIVNA